MVYTADGTTCFLTLGLVFCANLTWGLNRYDTRTGTTTATLPYVLLFLFRTGAPPMTLLTAGALTDPRLPATASHVCTTDARLGGVGRVPPPNKYPGYAGGLLKRTKQARVKEDDNQRNSAAE